MTFVSPLYWLIDVVTQLYLFICLCKYCPVNIFRLCLWMFLELHFLKVISNSFRATAVLQYSFDKFFILLHGFVHIRFAHQATLQDCILLWILTLVPRILLPMTDN